MEYIRASLMLRLWQQCAKYMDLEHEAHSEAWVHAASYAGVGWKSYTLNKNHTSGGHKGSSLAANHISRQTHNIMQLSQGQQACCMSCQSACIDWLECKSMHTSWRIVASEPSRGRPRCCSCSFFRSAANSSVGTSCSVDRVDAVRCSPMEALLESMGPTEPCLVRFGACEISTGLDSSAVPRVEPSLASLGDLVSRVSWTSRGGTCMHPQSLLRHHVSEMGSLCQGELLYRNAPMSRS